MGNIFLFCLFRVLVGAILKSEQAALLLRGQLPEKRRCRCMKTIYLITGAAGHLGSVLVRKLCAKGETVRALV